MGDDDLATAMWTTRQAAEAAHVSPTTIRAWARRGHLTAAATDDHGYPLYRALDVVRAEKKTRDRARRHYILVQP